MQRSPESAVWSRWSLSSWRSCSRCDFTSDWREPNGARSSGGKTCRNLCRPAMHGVDGWCVLKGTDNSPLASAVCPEARLCTHRLETMVSISAALSSPRNDAGGSRIQLCKSVIRSCSAAIPSQKSHGRATTLARMRGEPGACRNLPMSPTGGPFRGLKPCAA